ncbi:hypothetical protein HaLaN_09643, partial [Haematococcus lacustris]
MGSLYSLLIPALPPACGCAYGLPAALRPTLRCHQPATTVTPSPRRLFKRTSIRGHQFGTPFSFKCDFSLPPSASGDGPPSDTVADTLEAAPAVIGYITNLLVERLHCQRVGDMAGLRAKFDYLIDTQQHHYTSSELLNVRCEGWEDTGPCHGCECGLAKMILSPGGNGLLGRQG